MADPISEKLQAILEQCDPEERKALFEILRATHPIHKLEQSFGAPAEVILEAIDQAPELTRRMLKGVVADSAFRDVCSDHTRAAGMAGCDSARKFRL